MIDVPILRQLDRVGRPVFTWRRLFCCIIGFGALVACSSAVAGGATLQERLENATVLQEFDTEKAHIRQAKVARDHIAFLLWKKDSSIVVVRDLEGAEKFRFGKRDSIYHRLEWFNISEDGGTLVIAEGVGGEMCKLRVLDETGKLLFETLSGADLRPSPRGRFFCTESSLAMSVVFTIFNRNGDKIGQLRGFTEWNFGFISDERLLVVDVDSVRMVDTRTMDVIWIMPHRLEYRLIPTTPGISVSRAHSVAAIFNSRSVLLISANGEELWRYNSDDLLRAVSIDDHTRSLAVQFHDLDATYGYFRVCSLENPDVGIESREITSLARSHSRKRDLHWYSHGVIRVWGPWFAECWKHGKDYWTLFLECDLEALSLSAPVTVPGLFHSVEGQEGPSRYMRVKMPGTAAILRLEDPKGKQR